MQKFSPLYSLNSNGSIQQWTITVDRNKIIKTYGQMGGKFQTVEDVITEGKNIGRSNETTPAEQALAEARSQWEKKQAKGYHQDITRAQADEVDEDHVAGGVEPMLAQKFRDHESKIKYPCYAQPKLDGVRCIAIVQNGSCTLWTRNRKPITGVPHIVTAIETAYPRKSFILDGELYNHDYKSTFETIVSIVKQVEPKEGHEIVQYHVYDLVDMTRSFNLRSAFIDQLKLQAPLITVLTELVHNAEELNEAYNRHTGDGYEGCMARNAHSKYENKRSYNLQKIKPSDDAEFTVVGVKGGRGRMTDCAIFICEDNQGNRFDCKMKGTLQSLEKYLTRPELIVGKKLTIQHQGFSIYGTPRFPVGLRIREE